MQGLRKIFPFFIISCFIVLSANAVPAAVSVGITIPPLPDDIKKKEAIEQFPWTGDVFAGYTYVSGNTDKASATFSMNLAKKYGSSLFSLDGNMYYSETDKHMDGQKWDGLVKNSHDFGHDDRWFSFAQVFVDHEYFSDIDYRITPTAGLGYHIFIEEDWLWDIDAGLGYRITRHRANKTADDEALTALAHTFMKKKVFNKSFVAEDVTVYPGLKKDAGITVRSETVFSNPLNEKASLELKYIVDYDSQPAAGKTTTDKRFVAGLKYKF